MRRSYSQVGGGPVARTPVGLLFFRGSRVIDESRTPPEHPEWSESHRLLAVSDDGRSAVAFDVGIHTRAPAATPQERWSGFQWGSFHCVVFRSGADPIVIAENDMPVPAKHWEFRTSGLWVDNICETPFVHWSYGLEAFGLAIDDPEELLGRGYGDRVPLGWELEFESQPERYVDRRQLGTVVGELLFKSDQEPFSGPGLRRHILGRPMDDDGAVTALTASVSIDAEPVEVALPMRDGVWRVARTAIGIDCRFAPSTDHRP